MHSLQAMGEATPPSGRHVMSPNQGEEDVAGRRQSPHEGFPHEVTTDDAPDASVEPSEEALQDVPEAGAVEVSGPERGDMAEELDAVEELDDVAELVAEETEDMTYRLDALGEAEEDDAGEAPLDERNHEGTDGEPRALDAVEDETDGLWDEGTDALEVTDASPLVTEDVVRLEDEDGHETPRRGRRKRAKQKVGRRGPRFWKDED